MTAPELKPCPSGHPESFTGTLLRGDHFRQCSHGGCHWSTLGNTQEEVDRAWNDRPGEKVLWSGSMMVDDHGRPTFQFFSGGASSTGRYVRVKIVEA